MQQPPPLQGGYFLNQGFQQQQQPPPQPPMQGMFGSQTFVPTYLPPALFGQQPLPSNFGPSPQLNFSTFNNNNLYPPPQALQPSIVSPPSFSTPTTMPYFLSSQPTQFPSMAPMSPFVTPSPQISPFPSPFTPSSSSTSPLGYGSPSSPFTPTMCIPPPILPPPMPIPLVLPPPLTAEAKKARKKKIKWVASYIPNEADYQNAKKEVEGDAVDGWIVTTGAGGKSDRKHAKKYCHWESHGYCRSYNLKFHPEVCKDAHRFCQAQGVKLAQPPLTPLPPTSPEYPYYVNAFINKWHGPKPTVKGFYRIDVPHLNALFDRRKQFIESLNGSATVMTLYHGTRASVLMDIYCNGFALPADFAPDQKCKKSGMLPTDKASLCSAECRRCSNHKHTWNKCHMYGLGVYFADEPSKSDIYVSDSNGQKTKTGRKMLICEVALGNAMKVKQLKSADEMHDMVLPPSGYHSIHAIGMGLGSTIPTGKGGQLAVKLDEYIVFHPHQAVPKYLLEYDVP